MHAGAREMDTGIFDKPNREFWGDLSPPEGAALFLEFLQEVARGALSDKNRPFLTGKARKALTNALMLSGFAFDNVRRQLDERSHADIFRLMAYCYEIGQHSGFTKSQKNFAKHLRTHENAKASARTRRDEMNEGWRPHALAPHEFC
jgi:hypothetical protein